MNVRDSDGVTVIDGDLVMVGVEEVDGVNVLRET